MSLDSWLLEINCSHDVSLELMARLLSSRPLWEPEINENGLRICVPTESGEKNLSEDLEILREAALTVRRNRKDKLQINFTYNPEIQINSSQPERLGPFRLAFGSPAPHCLTVPENLTLSPRLTSIYNLILSSVADYLTPPPGAPDTKGQKTLVFEDGPAIAPIAAFLAGSGPVTLVASESLTKKRALTLAEINGFEDKLEIETMAPLPFVKKKAPELAQSYGLIIIQLSPYLTVKLLKALSGLLANGKSRLLVSGLHAGTQTAWLLKAAFRADLALWSSSVQNEWAVISLGKKPVSILPIWEWNPGDWRAVLNDDEEEALKDAESEKSLLDTGKESFIDEDTGEDEEIADEVDEADSGLKKDMAEITRVDEADSGLSEEYVAKKDEATSGKNKEEEALSEEDRIKDSNDNGNETASIFKENEELE